jgi:hypothetical protein
MVVVYLARPSAPQVWMILAVCAAAGVVGVAYGLLMFLRGKLGKVQQEELLGAIIRATSWGAFTFAFGVAIAVGCFVLSLPFTGGHGPSDGDWPRWMVAVGFVSGALAHLALLDAREKTAKSKGQDIGLARARQAWLSNLNLEDVERPAQGTVRCRTCGAVWAMYEAGLLSPLRPNWWACPSGCNLPTEPRTGNGRSLAGGLAATENHAI